MRKIHVNNKSDIQKAIDDGYDIIYISGTINLGSDFIYERSKK